MALPAVSSVTCNCQSVQNSPQPTRWILGRTKALLNSSSVTDSKVQKKLPLSFDFSCPSPGFIPVCSLGVCQVGRMNFGKDVSTLKYFTICGLQEGYEPFAVNMNRDVTMWLSKRLPQFVPVPPNHQHIEVRGGWGGWGCHLQDTLSTM